MCSNSQCSKFQGNLPKHARPIAISKALRKEEKFEENKTNFEGGNGLADSAQIWKWRYPTPRKFTQKILCVSVQGVLNYRCVKTALSVACPWFLGLHDNYHVCLDVYVVLSLDTPPYVACNCLTQNMQQHNVGLS